MKRKANEAQAAIDASILFENVHGFITRFVVLGSNESTAVALWAMMTHAIAAFDCVPYLMVSSAEKQCGKTRLLEVLALLVNRPWLTGRVTPAVLTRKIDKEQPTLLLDESDATFRGDKDFAQALRGVLNSGYLRSGKTSLCVTKGKTIEYVDLSTFGAKAIAGIGALPDTVADRSVPIHLTRRLPCEEVARFRRKRVEPEARALREDIEAWAKPFLEIEHVEPRGLDALPDRAADICEPLLTIAEAAGEELAARARDALSALCGRQREDEALGVRLLADVLAIFNAEGCDRIASTLLASKLEAIEEAPWEGYHGRPFGPRELAKLLKPFQIKPRTVRLDDVKTPKGYHRSDFADAWARFLPSPEKPPQPPQPPQGAQTPPQDAKPQREKAHAISAVADVADVAPRRNGNGKSVTGDGGLFEYATTAGLIEGPNE